MNYEESTKLIHDAMFLREEGNYDDCINLMRDNLPEIDEDAQIVALIQIFGAAKGKGDDSLARKTAQEIAKIDPELPSIQSYL